MKAVDQQKRVQRGQGCPLITLNKPLTFSDAVRKHSCLQGQVRSLVVSVRLRPG